MRSVSALDVRKRFGALLDEVAHGERLIIERAGQPIAALVPLTDIPNLNRDERIQRRLQAIAEIQAFAEQNGMPNIDAAAVIRKQRDERGDQIMSAVESAHEKRSGS